MEKVILDAINHIKNISKRKLSLDTILQRINKISATNLDTEALRSELEKMIFKGLIDHNYRILNKVISQTNIEPSPDKVSFTIDDNTEDKTKLNFYETSSIISDQDNPKAKAKIDLDSHNKFDSPTTNANPDASLTFVDIQDTPVIKSSCSCDKKKNLTPLISEVDIIRANMMALKSFLMNEIFDLRQEITSLKLQLQQEKLSESKTNPCENEEKIVIERLKTHITSYKTENEFLKEEMKSKQNILDEILHQNSQLLKFDRYFNDTTNKKENIREGKEYHSKLNHQQKKQLLKERTVLSKESQKSENKMHGKDQKKVFIVGDSTIKNITGTGISRENVVKMRPHPGATTINICDYIKPELRQKPDVVIVHCGTNDIPNNINTVKKIKKFVKEIEENNQENIPQVVISSIIKRYDQDYHEEIQSMNDKLQRFSTSKGLSFIDNNNIDKSCLNKGKLHLNRRGSSFLANNFKNFVNSL